MTSTLHVGPAALHRFLPRFVVIALLTLGILGPVGLPAARAMDSHQAEINATKQEIARVRAELDAARTELRQMQANKPQAPARGAGMAEQKAYDAALANWQQKVDALRARVSSLQIRLKELEQRLRTLGGQKSESTSSPAKK